MSRYGFRTDATILRRRWEQADLANILESLSIFDHRVDLDVLLEETRSLLHLVYAKPAKLSVFIIFKKHFAFNDFN